jgi:putative pyruvate formate lyase activating enzyme
MALLPDDCRDRGRDPRFVLDDFRPVYLQQRWQQEGFEARLKDARDALASCRCCPRLCGVDRRAGEPGICQIGEHPVVSSAFPHRGEEDCLRGLRGSGTIFFAGCNLRCVFCQNWEISHNTSGESVDGDQLATLMLGLQGQGCHNINFVTPEHVVPQVVEAIVFAQRRGLRLPIVYNTSAYDSMSTLALLDGLVDIYMPDFKFWKPQTARRLARASDYPQRAREAIAEMHRQVGVLKLGPDGLACRGVLVRHLVMPGKLDETAAILRWLADTLSTDTYVNLMAQYHPDHLVGKPGRSGRRYPDINRCPSAEELRAAYDAAAEAGIWRLDGRV